MIQSIEYFDGAGIVVVVVAFLIKLNTDVQY